jgi:hypothetical protein
MFYDMIAVQFLLSSSKLHNVDQYIGFLVEYTYIFVSLRCFEWLSLWEGSSWTNPTGRCWV